MNYFDINDLFSKIQLNEESFEEEFRKILKSIKEAKKYNYFQFDYYFKNENNINKIQTILDENGYYTYKYVNYLLIRWCYQPTKQF
jgi:hypothetical protein